MIRNITKWDFRMLNKLIAEPGREEIVLGEDDIDEDPLGLREK